MSGPASATSLTEARLKSIACSRWPNAVGCCGAIALLHAIATQHPAAFGHLLQAIDFRLAPVKEVALAGPDTSALERVVRAEFRPHVVLAGGGGDVPLLEGREAVDGRAAAYVCERFACQRPVTEPDELRALLTG